MAATRQTYSLRARQHNRREVVATHTIEATSLEKAKPDEVTADNFWDRQDAERREHLFSSTSSFSNDSLSSSASSISRRQIARERRENKENISESIVSSTPLASQKTRSADSDSDRLFSSINPRIPGSDAKTPRGRHKITNVNPKKSNRKCKGKTFPQNVPVLNKLGSRDRKISSYDFSDLNEYSLLVCEPSPQPAVVFPSPLVGFPSPDPTQEISSVSSYIRGRLSSNSLVIDNDVRIPFNIDDDGCENVSISSVSRDPRRVSQDACRVSLDPHSVSVDVNELRLNHVYDSCNNVSGDANRLHSRQTEDGRRSPSGDVGSLKVQHGYTRIVSTESSLTPSESPVLEASYDADINCDSDSLFSYNSVTPSRLFLAQAYSRLAYSTSDPSTSAHQARPKSRNLSEKTGPGNKTVDVAQLQKNFRRFFLSDVTAAPSGDIGDDYTDVTDDSSDDGGDERRHSIEYFVTGKINLSNITEDDSVSQYSDDSSGDATTSGCLTSVSGRSKVVARGDETRTSHAELSEIPKPPSSCGIHNSETLSQDSEISHPHRRHGCVNEATVNDSRRGNANCDLATCSPVQETAPSHGQERRTEGVSRGSEGKQQTDADVPNNDVFMTPKSKQPPCSLSFRESMTPKLPPLMSSRQKVLAQCYHNTPVSFSKCMPFGMLGRCKKIGEGVYGEVFRTVNAHKESVAVKIIPIEGDARINGEVQNTFASVLPEVVISRELSNLRRGPRNLTSNFIQVHKVSCVRGAYPECLLRQWDEFHARRQSENDRPDEFGVDQLYVVFEFAFGGTSLEEFELSDVHQAVSVFAQVSHGLAVAELALQFEHRDLHWGNVLVKHTSTRSVRYVMDGQETAVLTHGVTVTIIDFTLSRLCKDGCTTFCNLSNDPEIFAGDGDSQFDVYRAMQLETGDDWQAFHPRTNVLWLDYLARKLFLNTKSFASKKRVDTLKLRDMRKFIGEITTFSSAYDLVTATKDILT